MLINNTRWYMVAFVIALMAVSNINCMVGEQVCPPSLLPTCPPSYCPPSCPPSNPAV